MGWISAPELGCIPICLEKLGHMDMTAVDISPKALAFARENNEKNQTHVDFVESDLFTALPGQSVPFGLYRVQSALYSGGGLRGADDRSSGL